VIQVPPPRLIKDEVIIEEVHAKGHTNTLGIIQTLYDMADEGLRDSCLVEYFEELLRKMKDKMCPINTY